MRPPTPARDVSVRCTDYRLDMIHTASHCKHLFYMSYRAPAASSAIHGGGSLTRSERREVLSGPASTAIGDVVGTRGAELSRPTPHTRDKGLRLPAGTEHSVHMSPDQ